MRISKQTRKSNETDIKLNLNIDGSGEVNVDTGVGFFDHMLTLMAVHAGFDLDLKCDGDIEVDSHHTIEDCGIVLGKAIEEALGDRIGIQRYGDFMLPMDETMAQVILDISGRAFLRYDAPVMSPLIGNMQTQMVKEFFRAVSAQAKITLHINVPYGENDHHIIEAIFKAFGRALKKACLIVSDKIPSTKGILD